MGRVIESLFQHGGYDVISRRKVPLPGNLASKHKSICLCTVRTYAVVCCST